MNTVVDQRIILNMVLVVNLVKFTELSLLLLRLSQASLLPGVQSNAIASSMHNAIHVPQWLMGAIVVVILGLIIFGGVRSIANVATAVVPFMAIIYILMAVIIICINIQEVPALFALIFKSAFGLQSAFGGIVGAMIEIGVKCGLYSNEAGQGTEPHAAAAAEVSHPISKQGLIQAFSVYIDTLFVCTATALIILISGTYNVNLMVRLMRMAHRI